MPLVMPLPDNGGGLLAWLIILGVAGLAMLTHYVTRNRCAHCRTVVGDSPRFWVLPQTPGECPVPLCRDCFVAHGRTDR